MRVEGHASRASRPISHISRGTQAVRPAARGGRRGRLALRLATVPAGGLQLALAGGSRLARPALSSFVIMVRCNYYHPGVNGALFGVSGNVTALHRPYCAVPPQSAFFLASLHIMTPAAEKAPLLPHCTAFIPLEKQKRRIYKRRKSPPWAPWELPSPLGQFFLQDGAWRGIIFKLAHQAPSNLPFAITRRPSSECEGLARDAQLNASFGRLSGRIGNAASRAPVAQRIERRFPKPCVGGSSPLRGATFSAAASAFSSLMPTFRISIFPIPPKSTCAG